LINEIQKYITQVVRDSSLSEADAAHAFQIIMNGGATPAEMGALLVALKMRGETAEEIAGAARAMRTKMTPFVAPTGAMDTCGTGGDGKHTLNVSTATALVLAACGVPVVKHGNRAVSSASGSADVLKSLGVNIDADIPTMQRTLEKTNFCFLMAPKFHPAMRHVAPVRQELKIRTIFNLIGPLCNPAKPTFQLLGVYDAKWLEPLAHALKELGVLRAWVVHGHDGVDELSISGVSKVVQLDNGAITSFSVSPEDAGLESAPLSDITGKDSLYNAKAIERLLNGEPSAYRNAVLLNAGAALVIAQKAESLKEGASIAADAIDSRKAKETLAGVIWHSNEDKPHV
jgi:anthranilate phosphoribosyltransferase